MKNKISNKEFTDNSLQRRRCVIYNNYNTSENMYIIMYNKIWHSYYYNININLAVTTNHGDNTPPPPLGW